MDYQALSAFFISGDIKGAIDYMSMFPEMEETVNAYRALFENEEYLHYDIPEELNEILLLYQKYYREVFYLKNPADAAATRLIKGLSYKLGIPVPGNYRYDSDAEDSSDLLKSLSEALVKVFEENGYHIQTGMTGGYFGPYVYKERVPKTYEVEIPSGVKLYKVNILKGFIMRSHMDYLTFGRKGTRGWAGYDNVINCVDSAWDFESEEFKVSLLKHEAQHIDDYEKFPQLTPIELEYRAKLVEIMYSESNSLLLKFISQANKDAPENDGHAHANAKIAEKMKDFTDKPAEEIKKKARMLFEEDNVLQKEKRTK